MANTASAIPGGKTAAPQASALPVWDPAAGLVLTPTERSVIRVCLLCVAVAVAFPFPFVKYGLGAVLALTFVSSGLRHYYVAIAFFAFLLPLTELLPIGSFIVPGLNAQTLLVFFFVGLAASSAPQLNRANQIITSNPVTLPLALLILTVILSSVRTSLETGASLGDMLARVKNWFIYATFLFLSYKCVRNPREKLFVLLLIFVVIVLLAANSTRGVIADQGLGLNLLRHRATSMLLNQPNLWGGFLAMYAFFFIAVLVVLPLSKKAKLMLLAATCVVLVNLVYSLSRGAWLAFVVAAVFLATAKARRLVVPLALIGMLLSVWMPDVAVERFESGMQDEYDPSLLVAEDAEAMDAAARIKQWRNFLPMLLESPVFGTGFDTYANEYFRAGLGPRPKSAHSSVIEIGIEQGIPGLVFYSWILIAAYGAATRVYRDAAHPVDRALALGLLGATVCLFLLDLTGTRFRNGNLMAYYWILAGMTFNAVAAAPVASPLPGVSRVGQFAPTRMRPLPR
jgi:O-antigen ligase